MIRTQVYLTEQQAQTIKRQAHREQRPEAEVIRDLVDKGLLVSRGQKPQTAGESLLEVAALGERYGLKGPRDLSTNHDDYLYGDKK